MENSFIRNMAESDQDWVCKLLADPIMTKYLPFAPMNRETAIERFQSYLQLNHDTFPHCAKVLQFQGRAAGYAFVRPFIFEDASKDLELAWLIDPQFWSRGIGLKLAKELTHSLTPECPAVAIIHKDNFASQKIAEKVGFIEIGTSSYVDQRIWRLSKKIEMIFPTLNI